MRGDDHPLAVCGVTPSTRLSRRPGAELRIPFCGMLDRLWKKKIPKLTQSLMNDKDMQADPGSSHRFLPAKCSSKLGRMAPLGSE